MEKDDKIIKYNTNSTCDSLPLSRANENSFSYNMNQVHSKFENNMLIE